MENFNNENYGQIDPDFIEQNTFIESSMNSYYDDEMKFDLHNQEDNYGVSDPDYIEQNIFIENEFAAIYEEQNHFHYNEDFLDEHNYQTDEKLRAENIPNEERIVNEDGLITNDEERSDLDDDNSTGLDYEDEDIEKDGDLDDDEELDDFDAEHYPENHPRE